MTRQDWILGMLLAALLVLLVGTPWPGHDAFFAHLDQFNARYLPLPIL